MSQIRSQKNENDPIGERYQRGKDQPHQREMENTPYIQQTVSQHSVSHDCQRNENKVSKRIKINTVDGRDVAGSQSRHQKQGKYDVFYLHPHHLIPLRPQSLDGNNGDVYE